MTHPIAAQFLASLGRSAEYLVSGGSPVPCRAIVKDIDREIRISRSSELIAADAVASIDEALNPRRGALLTIGENRYEITGKVRSGAPGLVDLALSRIAGNGVDVEGFGPSILDIMGENIVIDGRPVRAHVNRSGLLLEEDRMGNPIEVIRYVVAVSVTDAVGISAGSVARIDGREHRILRMLRDGVGMLRLVC